MLTGLPLFLLIFGILLFIVVACAFLRWHPFLVLLAAAIVTGLGTGFTAESTLNTLVQGGGSVFASIGFVIALGTILGEILEKTGAILSIASAIVRKLGRKHLLPAISLMGAITGIPVFCDSGFVILSGLARSLARQYSVSFSAVSIALATGLYTSHVLIPPTPGPLAAIGALGLSDNIGWVLLLGIVVSIPAIVVGWWFAKRSGTDKTETPEEEITVIQHPQHLPPFFHSLLPLLLPVFLIAAGSFAPLLSLSPFLHALVRLICNPNVALLAGVLTAFLILGPAQRKEWNAWIQHALSQAGPIIFITAAGGALGAMLKATPLADSFGRVFTGTNLSTLALFPVAFLLAAGLKTAQGSSTASLLITSSIIAPLLAGLPPMHVAEKALTVLSIGAGAMSVSHANDSYFWVVSQYGRLSVGSMYRYFTTATFFMGLAVLLCCLLLAFLF